MLGLVSKNKFNELKKAYLEAQIELEDKKMVIETLKREIKNKIAVKKPRKTKVDKLDT